MSFQGEDHTFFSRPQLYGGFGGFSREAAARLPDGKGKASSFFLRSQRQRLNLVPICACFLLPWLFFCAVYAIMSFRLHYTKPSLCWALVSLGLVAVAACGSFALVSAFRKLRAARGDEWARPPTWLAFLFVSLLAAWVLGVILGNLNFWTNMQQYYDYVNLNDHWDVNPARMQGRQLMDSGRVYFVKNSTLDLRRSMGFKNLDTYCVAPITVKTPAGMMLPLQTYDFWAVGLDCCEGNTASFRCGEYNDPGVHQGLRLLQDDQRAFFRLAVQQAEATYSIKAMHPLFFYWARDATSEMNFLRDEGYKYYLLGMLVHFAWQILCVALAAVGFAKLGQY